VPKDASAGFGFGAFAGTKLPRDAKGCGGGAEAAIIGGVKWDDCDDCNGGTDDGNDGMRNGEGLDG
jgi:hypothetical protein